MVKEGAVVIDVGIHRIKDNSEKGYHVVGGNVLLPESAPLGKKKARHGCAQLLTIVLYHIWIH